MNPSSQNLEEHQEEPLSPDDINEGGEVIGIEQDVVKLVQQLIGGTVSWRVLSVVGARGIGKTFLAKKVYENTQIARHFPTRVWVTLPQNFGLKEIFQVMVKQLLGEVELEWDVKELRMVIFNLLKDSRYLIVLDDVRTSKVWDVVISVLPQAANGSRIMITTQKREVAVSTESYCPFIVMHAMRSLSEEEGLELLKSKVEVPIEVEQLGREIVNKCMGLPLAILVAGAILSTKKATKQHCLEILKKIEQDHLSLYYTLNSVADTLPEYLKQYLYYFGFFPQDYEVPVRRLIILWIAEGLVRHQRSDKDPPEYVAEKHLTELIHLNLIQVCKRKPDGRVKTCRMNCLLSDRWVFKAKEANFIQSPGEATRLEPSSKTRTIHRLADHLDVKDDSFPHIHGEKYDNLFLLSHYRDLCSYLSFDFREGPVPGEEIEKFLYRGISAKCFKRLRVIDLEGVFRPKLPDNIGKLIELRYLGLRWTYLEMLPSSIGNLINLQTLDLKHTYISILPSSLWKMQQLRHLYLSDSYRSRFVAPADKGSVIDHQTLWGAFVDEESLVEAGLYRLNRIRKLGLVCQLTSKQKQKALAEWVGKLKNLENLRLKSIDEWVKPSNLYLESMSHLKNLSSIYLLGKLENQVFPNFPINVTEITLSVSELKEDPMPKLGELPKLSILKLLSNSYVGKSMVCSKGGFPLLRVLKLWKLDALEEWTVEVGAMTIVEEIEMRSCKNLKMIPEGLRHLLQCRELKLKSMSKGLETRVAENRGQDWYKIAHIANIHVVKT